MVKKVGCKNPYAVIQIDRKTGRLPKDIDPTALIFCNKKEAVSNARKTSRDPSWSDYKYVPVQILLPPTMDVTEKKRG